MACLVDAVEPVFPAWDTGGYVSQVGRQLDWYWRNCVMLSMFVALALVSKAPGTPYRIGEIDGSRTKSSEIC